MEKKAVLGLDTAKLFVLAILVLTIISVITLIVLDSMSDVQGNAYGGALSNATTLTSVNSTSVAYPKGLSSSSLDCVLTVTAVTNASDGLLIPSTNYSIIDCTISCTEDSCELYNNSLWNISGTFTNSSASKVITYNTSSAISAFFSDAGTWFTLIGVVIVILIIAVVIVVVNRMGTGGAFSGTPQTANI